MVTVSTYTGRIQNGKIELPHNEPLPEGAQFVVTIINDVDTSEVKGITAAEVLASGMIGMWADRNDIEDSAKFAEELREKAQRRNFDSD